MNDTFNIKRLLLALRRLIVERGVKMIGSILMIILICTFFLSVEGSPESYTGMRSAFLALGVMFGPITYSWIVSNEFSNNSQGISYLLLPSSRVEKWLINNFFAIAIYIFVFLILFTLVDYWIIDMITKDFQLDPGTIPPITFDHDLFIIPCLAGIALSISIMIGSLYFNKNGLALTLLVLFGAFIILLTSNYFISNSFFDETINFFNQAPFLGLYIDNPNSLTGTYYIKAPWEETRTLKTVLISLILILSTVYLVRIREKQL